MSKQHFVVTVPATSGNVGPGFDVAGLALTLRNELEVELRGERLSVEIVGEGADSLPRNRSNIVIRAMQRVFDEVGAALPPATLRCHNRIPLSRGLGSSAAARVAGLVAANQLLPSRKRLKPDRLLALATELEGHPDNVAPALLGGVVLSSVDDEGHVVTAKLVPRELQLVLLVPAVELATSKARAVLPKQVPMRDAVFNVGKTALFVAAMSSGREDLLRAALHDRLHQPYRAQLMPWLPGCIEAAVNAGALGAVLSGAGTAILALTRRNTKAIGAALLTELRKHGVAGSVKHLRVSETGATVNGEPLR